MGLVDRSSGSVVVADHLVARRRRWITGGEYRLEAYEYPCYPLGHLISVSLRQMIVKRALFKTPPSRAEAHVLSWIIGLVTLNFFLIHLH